MGGPVVGARLSAMGEFRTGLEARRKPWHQPRPKEEKFPSDRPGLASVESGLGNTMRGVGGGGSQFQVAELLHTYSASDPNPPVGDPACECPRCVRALRASIHSTYSQVSSGGTGPPLHCVACVRARCVRREGRVTTQSRWNARGAGKGEVSRAGLVVLSRACAVQERRRGRKRGSGTAAVGSAWGPTRVPGQARPGPH